MKRQAKSYQVRMVSMQWWVYFLNNMGSVIRSEGPFKKIDEAKKIAEDSGLPDSDKSRLPWHSAGGKDEHPQLDPATTS